MTSLYIKTARYSIAAAVLALLFTAVPTFAAKKDTRPQRAIAQASTATTTQASTSTADASNKTTDDSTVEATTSSPAQSTTQTNTEATSTPPPQTASSTEVIPPASGGQTDPATAAAQATSSDAVTPTEPVVAASPSRSPVASAITAVEHAVTSVKDKIFAKPVATTSTTTVATGAISTTGIASLFAGPALSGNVYASNQFGESDTYKLLALALALAAAGLFLTNTEVFSRTYGGLSHAITIPSVQTSRSRA